MLIPSSWCELSRELPFSFGGEGAAVNEVSLPPFSVSSFPSSAVKFPACSLSSCRCRLRARNWRRSAASPGPCRTRRSSPARPAATQSRGVRPSLFAAPGSAPALSSRFAAALELCAPKAYTRGTTPWSSSWFSAFWAPAAMRSCTSLSRKTSSINVARQAQCSRFMPCISTPSQSFWRSSFRILVSRFRVSILLDMAVYIKGQRPYLSFIVISWPFFRQNFMERWSYFITNELNCDTFSS
mmetsp:Transcript_27237/g.47376  ORF Transcript_27237/g.47376 Transcript_27237/m.47376 type:complete len:241 (-) Transcript_27237:216-938(-)